MEAIEVVEATLDDIEEIADAAEALHQEDPEHAHLSMDRDKVRAWIVMHIEQPNMCLWVAKDQGKIVGGIFGSVDDFFWGHTKAVWEESFYVYPEYRGSMAAFLLLSTMIGWAQTMGADRAFVTVSSYIDQERTIKFLERGGFKKYAVTMMYGGNGESN